MIRVGVAGWSYPDWEGIVYPASKAVGFDRLSYLARYFDTLEINTSFYRIPAPATAARWASVRCRRCRLRPAMSNPSICGVT